LRLMGVSLSWFASWYVVYRLPCTAAKPK
jgi:hypothetical protein